MDGMSISPLPAGMPGMEGKLNSLVRGADNADGKGLDSVATEFESLFLSMMMKEMRSSLGDDSLFGGESSDVYGGMFDMMLGQSMAESQPLGIARLLQSAMGYQADKPVGEGNLDQPSDEKPVSTAINIDA